MDARLAQLLDREEIRSVVYTYCRGIDRLDLDSVRRCYHPDATDHHGSFEGGVDAYLEWVEALLRRYRFTMHFVGNIEIEFGGATDRAADAAADVAGVESYGVALHRGLDATPHLNLATGFRYLDRFERRGGPWRIARRVAVSEWSIRVPEESWWAIPETLLQGRRDGTDALFALLASVRGANPESDGSRTKEAPT